MRTVGTGRNDSHAVFKNITPITMKEQIPTSERGGSGLSTEQIASLRDIGEIRKEHHEPEHGRLTRYEQWEHATEDFSIDDPVPRDERRLYANGRQITTWRDLIGALVEEHENEPKLYVFDARDSGKIEHVGIPENDIDLER